MSFKKYAHEMCVKVEDGALHIIIDVETGEFLVGELPSNDEVTKLIALGVCELALDACPMARYAARDKL